MTEQWKAIPDWEGYYSASTLGRVRSEPRTVTRSDGVVQRHQGKVLATKDSSSGRAVVQLCLDGRMYPRLVHRLIAQTFIPNPNGHPLVRHLNDDPGRNEVTNLAWGTYSENQLDRVRNGIYRNGREQQTHCTHGHEFTPENTLRVATRPGHRVCRTCVVTRAHEYRRRRKEGRDG